MSNAFDDATQLSERSNEPHGKQGFTMPKLPERPGSNIMSPPTWTVRYWARMARRPR